MTTSNKIGTNNEIPTGHGKIEHVRELIAKWFPESLRSTAAGPGASFVDWFRARPEYDFGNKEPKLVFERVGNAEAPDWLHYFTSEGPGLVMHEAEALEHYVGPGSLALLKLDPPQGHKSWTDCGYEYDCDYPWEIAYAVPHPCLAEAWRRTRERGAAAIAEENTARGAELARVWRQPWRMRVDLQHHDGMSFQGVGDGPPWFDERLHGHAARLVADPMSFSFRDGGVTSARHWLVYGPKRATADEAIAALQEKVREAGHRLDIMRLQRHGKDRCFRCR